MISHDKDTNCQGVYVRFHFGWNEIFTFQCLVNFLKLLTWCNPKRKSLQSFRQKWNFISGDKIACKHYPKWNHVKRNICICINKNDWLLPNGSFISDQPWNDIHFISPVMKSNLNVISFMLDWDFVSGRFQFLPHVNILFNY